MNNLWLIPLVVVAALFLLTIFRGAPYVPTRKKDLKRAFTALCPLTEKDTVIDIGSGDGVVLRQAAAHGARAIGYEVNPVLVIVSRFLNRRYGRQIETRLADFWYAKFPPETTLVYTFGESRDIKRMYAYVAREATRLEKPLFFMSYGFAVEGKPIYKSDKSFYLYKIAPLLEDEAQV